MRWCRWNDDADVTAPAAMAAVIGEAAESSLKTSPPLPIPPAPPPAPPPLLLLPPIPKSSPMLSAVSARTTGDTVGIIAYPFAFAALAVAVA